MVQHGIVAYVLQRRLLLIDAFNILGNLLQFILLTTS